MKTSGIGGQAVMEGVMMKNQKDYAIAVRKPDGQIEVKKESYESFLQKHNLSNVLILRGMVIFVESMVVGMKALTFSSEFFEEAEEDKDSKTESICKKVFKDKAESVIMFFTIVISMVIAIGLFVFVPYVVAALLNKYIQSVIFLSLCEGVFRLVLFLGYILLISQLNDIKRVFMYHGAEHKSINCIENGYELTVENVRMQSREHKRCGTSFLVYVMLISIIFFTCIHTESRLIQILLRLVLIPVIAGISYELIRFAGKSNAGVMNVLSRPGMWVQGLTTREPEDCMIEVAIQSVEAVFDWKSFLKQEFSDNKLFSEANQDTVAAEEDDIAENVEIQDWDAENKEKGNHGYYYKDNVLEDIEEEDEVLRALDQYFEGRKKENEG